MADQEIISRGAKVQGKPCKRGHSGLRFASNNWCVECARERKGDWKERNPDRIREYSREYHEANRDERIEKSQAYFQTEAGKATQKRSRVKYQEKRNAESQAWRAANPEKQAAANKRWYDANREKLRDYARQRQAAKLADDLNFKLAVYLRSRVNRAIQRGQKGGSMVRDLGCSIPELIQHIENQFQPGMSWANWAQDGWHIDHIQPLASFDLTVREEFLKACHYTNLQPLWSLDNLRKGDSIGQHCCVVACAPTL